MPLAALETVGDPLGKVARVLMEICSYAGEHSIVCSVQCGTYVCSRAHTCAQYWLVLVASYVYSIVCCSGLCCMLFVCRDW